MSEIKTNLLGFLAPPKNLVAKFTNIFFSSRVNIFFNKNFRKLEHFQFRCYGKFKPDIFKNYMIIKSRTS